LGIEVPDSLAIRTSGRTIKLDGLKTGDMICLRWMREGDCLVAECISVIGTGDHDRASREGLLLNGW